MTPPAERLCALYRLTGNSPGIRAVRDRIQRVARSMAPVLIHGESGTGKELAARAIHDCSPRASGPFIAINCSAIPENLLEAEFFGSLKGAYTGAAQNREGLFQAAQGGTLFLDEIGDLPLSMQAKLLRAIQERRVRPIGATEETPVEVRIISATHRDLNAGTMAGTFRRDLFYRLNVIDIEMPPLRKRREDIPLLCEALLERIASTDGRHSQDSQDKPKLSPTLLAQLMAHPLNGNVRELENLLHRAITLGEDTLCDGMSLDATTPQVPDTANAATATGARPSAALDIPVPHDLQAHLDAYETAIIQHALKQNNYNRTATAAKLGLSLRQIRYRIARLNIPMQDKAASLA